jgi:hypothetical protein
MEPSAARKKPRILDLSHELEEYKRTGDPQKLLDALRDEARIKAGIEAEEIKYLAANVLDKAIASQDISTNMLLRIIVSLSKSTEAVLKELGATGRQRRRKRAGARHPPPQPSLR